MLPIPDDLPDKLWELGPLFYGLVIVSLSSIGGMVAVFKLFRDSVKDRVEAIKDKAIFIESLLAQQRADAELRRADDRENLEVLRGLNHILTTMGRDTEKGITELKEEIKRAANETQKHVTEKIRNLKIRAARGGYNDGEEDEP